MSNEDRKFVNRRSVLKASAVFGGVGILSGLSSARPSQLSTKAREERLDTASIEGVDKATVSFYDNEQISIEASGRKAFESDSNMFGIQITEPDTSKQYQPATARVGLIPHPSSKKPNIKSSEISSKRSCSDCDPSTNAAEYSSNSSIGTRAAGDKDKSNSGKDYTKDYEGGLRVQLNQEIDYCRHGLTYKWGSSGGNVNSWSGHRCWQSARFDIKPWTHKGSGWERQDSSGSTYFGKAYSQWERYSYRVVQLASLTLEPDGQMQWWGRCYTVDRQGGIGSGGGISIGFKVFTDYWQNCEDWAT